MGFFWIYYIEKTEEKIDSQKLKQVHHIQMPKNFLRNGICPKNLGFVLTGHKELWGVFSIEYPLDQAKENLSASGQDANVSGKLRCLRRYKHPLTKQHFIRFGLLSIMKNAMEMNASCSFLSIKKFEYKRLFFILNSINNIDNFPLHISVFPQEENIHFLVRADSISPDLHFRMVRDKTGLARSGKYLHFLKQNLQDVSGNRLEFDTAYQDLINQARSFTSTLFANGESYRLFPQRNIMLANAVHGFFPWEILTFSDYTLSLERNFSRLQQWDGQVYTAEAMMRKKIEKNVGFFDALQTNASFEEFSMIRQITEFTHSYPVDYVALNRKDDFYNHFNKYAIIHLSAHGIIRNGQLFIQVENQEILLRSGEVPMPYPIVLVAHLCSSAFQNNIQIPSFPGYHVLIPDVNIKEGSQSSFLQAFYLQIFKNQKFSIAVKAARKNAFQVQEDPFAFVYYGNGLQNLGFFD